MDRVSSLMVRRSRLPRLSIAQRVVDKMVANARVYETETGESLVGFALKSMGRPEPDLYVIDTIPPDESAIRRGAYFEQGDDLQGDIFNWWFDNWNQARQQRKGSYGNALGAKWDAPLMYLGDWHKHPGTLIEPSWGDTDTARRHIRDSEEGTPQILAILATVWDKQHADDFDGENPPEPRPIKVQIDDSTIIRLDCWYISHHTHRFVRLGATVMDDRLMPQLPPIGWHLSQPRRLNAEIEALRAAGYSVSLEEHDADHEPPVEICLPLARRDAQHVIIVVTQADYPAHRPQLRTVPMAAMKDIPEGGDLFLNLWSHSTPLSAELYPSWAWTPDHKIAELVRDVEAKLASTESSKK